MDALVTVVLEETQDAPIPLERLAAGIRQPTFVLSLGRKSCPPALPLYPQVLEAESAVAALAAVTFPDLPFDINSSKSNGEADADFFFEPDLTAGVTPLHASTRRDQATSRTRWQFETRVEHYGRVPLVANAEAT